MSIEHKKTIVNPDPFAPVRLTRLKIGDRHTDKLCIEIQKPDSDDWEDIAGVAATHSEDYRLVPNQDVHEMLQHIIDKTGYNFRSIGSRAGSKASPMLWDGRRYVERRYTPDVQIPTEHGSSMMLGVEARNSYDGSSAVSLSFFAMHLACENQFHSSNLLGAPFRFRHIGAGETSEAEFEASLSRLDTAAETFARIAPEIRRLGATKINSVGDLLDIRRRMRDEAGFTFRDAQILDELDSHKITQGVGLDVGDAYGASTSLWALVNAITAVTTHHVGGVGASDQASRAIDFLLREARDRGGL